MMASSLTHPSAADMMSWSRAKAFLLNAGWSLDDNSRGGSDLCFDHKTSLGQLTDHELVDDDQVDAHALLRAAGGGVLDRKLADSVEDATTVDEVLVGLNWTIVRAGPFVGIARSPQRGTGGARTVRQGEPIAGRSLSCLAQWLCSLDPLRRSVGLAAVNAYWNRPERGTVVSHKWGLAAFDPPGDGLVIIGGFRQAQKRLFAARIVEREPKDNDIPEDESSVALQSARAVAITAQTLMNGSLEPLLNRVGQQAERLLVGPSAPVAPVVLESGIDRVSGLAITDGDAAASFIKETGTMIALDHMTAQLELAR
ncbi:MAG: DUF364 domain-containing protein [Rhodobacteraceae bacterium]|nr:DUF364 domain-containing protein [Paracoccaceae bacterium]MCY4196475.1 DUF364 domain-containing protein [Paracoccaceae bacterium]MCY4328050.1 DUF364 domain-containing protein [Paracoccaceae bacterium]